MNSSINASLNWSINASKQDFNTLWKKTNEEQLFWFIPTLVWMFAICFCGLPGNALVLYLYWTKFALSNYQGCIITLTLIGCFSCAVAVPLDTTLLLKGYDYNESKEHDLIASRDILCKISRFVNVFITFSSNFILGLIAVDRYMKVCRPFQKQLSPIRTRILCACLMILAILFSLPSIQVFGRKAFDTVDDKKRLTLFHCSVSDDYTSSRLTLAFLGFLIILSLLLTSLDILLYSLIGCKIKHELVRQSVKRKNKQLFLNSQNKLRLSTSLYNDKEDHVEEITVPDQLKTSSELVSNDDVSIDQSEEEVDISSDLSNLKYLTEASLPQQENDNTESFVETNFHRKLKCTISYRRIRRTRARRSARIMFIISLIYILSYIPNLTIIIMSAISKGFYNDTSSAERGLISFLIRSYFLTFSMNPFICLLCDSRLKNASMTFFSKLRTLLLPKQKFTVVL